MESIIASLVDTSIHIPGTTKLCREGEPHSLQMAGSLFEQSAFLFLEAIVLEIYQKRKKWKFIKKEKKMSAAFHHDMPSLNKGGNMKPVLQLALDFVDLKRALKNAQAGIAGGVDWLEAGTPLIKSEGLHAVRELRRLFPDDHGCRSN